ncbi:MAG: hypothetical protein AABX73_01115 [Nanoarchaeota archaeon]
MLKKNLLLGAVFVLIAVVSLSIVDAAVSKRSISDVRKFSDDSVVRSGRSSLRTNGNGALMHLSTFKLQPGSAVTVWWVIFNYPENCSHPEGAYRCGVGDLELAEENDSVKSSVLYADGTTIRESGRGDFSARLKVGDLGGALFGPGLINPLGADIHLVVRSHGRLIPGLVKEQISTFGGGCNNAPPGTGIPGPNTCEDLQFSVHEQ